MMRLLLIQFAFVASSLFAQFHLLTTVRAHPSASLVAAGPNDNLWIAGESEVIRIDTRGRILWTFRTENIGAIAGLAVDPQGTLAIIASDATRGYLVMVDPDGFFQGRTELGAIPEAIQADTRGYLYITGRAMDGFVGTAGAYKERATELLCQKPNTQQAAACDDAFIMKRHVSGRVEWTTLLGGGFADHGTAIAIDPSGSIWIAGETLSPNIPVTADAVQRIYGGGETSGSIAYGDAFIARIDATGRQLEYATYLGGSRLDKPTAIAVAASGALVSGVTESRNFPMSLDAYQRSLANSQVTPPNTQTDVFLSYIGTNGRLLYSTLYGLEGNQTATSITRGTGDRFAVALDGFSQRCILDLRATEKVEAFIPACYQPALESPFYTQPVNGGWLAIGRSKPGINVPPNQTSPFITIRPLEGVGDNSGPAVVGVWNDYNPALRPVAAPGMFISIYLPGLNAPNGVSVTLANRQLNVLYVGNGQANVYIPADQPIGSASLVVNLPFFTTVPVQLDLLPRWPGLASAALNQNGSINSEANPADRGTIVSLFGTGFGAAPYPVIEPFIQASEPEGAQGMEVLFAGQISPGLSQMNVRVPLNATPGHTPIRLIFREANGNLQSNLARIFVR